MSRAFIKETDAPDGLPELPVSPHPNRVTAGGLAQLRGRLLQTQQILADGGLSEHDRAYAERDLRWLRARVEGAVLSRPEHPDRVGFGSSAELQDAQGRRYRFRVVGEDEADPARGLLSWVSPLARALTGARAGDRVVWPRPAGDLEVRVVSVSAED